MPYKDKEDRREWERSEEQLERARERKRRQRDKQNLIDHLQAVQALVDRVGHDRFIGPGMREKLKKYAPEIQAFRDRQMSEVVEMKVARPVDEEYWTTQK